MNFGSANSLHIIIAKIFYFWRYLTTILASNNNKINHTLAVINKVLLQKGLSAEYLATIEAIFYALSESFKANKSLAKSDEIIAGTDLDTVLFWFYFLRSRLKQDIPCGALKCFQYFQCFCL